MLVSKAIVVPPEPASRRLITRLVDRNSIPESAGFLERLLEGEAATEAMREKERRPIISRDVEAMIVDEQAPNRVAPKRSPLRPPIRSPATNRRPLGVEEGVEEEESRRRGQLLPLDRESPETTTGVDSGMAPRRSSAGEGTVSEEVEPEMAPEYEEGVEFRAGNAPEYSASSSRDARRDMLSRGG